MRRRGHPVPNVFLKSGKFIIEENLENCRPILDEIRLIEKIKDVIHLLEQIHKENLSKDIKELLVDKFTKDSKYSSEKIFNNMLEESNRNLNEGLKDQIREILHYADKQINSLAIPFGIIHGDVSPRNILINKENKLFLVDWSDCRYDLVSLDIAQMIYLGGLYEYIDFIISEYCYSITRNVVNSHILLSMVYDYLDYNKKNIVENDLINYIDERF